MVKGVKIITRINSIPVEQLTDDHLACEHYEIVRVYTLVRGAIERGERPDDPRNPLTYRTGAGHVRFFYPLLKYIRIREIQIHVEMLFRGIPLYRPLWDISDIPAHWFGEFFPDEASRIVNRRRLNERNLELEKLVMKGYYLD